MSLASKMLRAFAMERRFLVQLHALETTNPTAGMQGKGECCRSGVCCWRRPGALSQDDVPKIAALLGIDAQTLFAKWLMVDRIEGRLLLLPRREHQVGGTLVPWEETYSLQSPCVFLDVANKNACKIHDAKPTVCQSFACWEKRQYPLPPEWTSDELLALGWDGDTTDMG